MEYFIAILLGAVQGATEFLPVSSSGHLLLLHELFPIFPDDIGLSFDVALHLATALVLLVFFGRRFWEAIRGVLRSPTGQSGHLFWMIVFGTIPAAAAGFFFDTIIETTLRHAWIVGVTLTIGGVLLLAVERYGVKRQEYASATFTQVLVVGVGQMFALIPGMSRSGMTIIAGMTVGLHRRAATDFAFLLGVPIIFVAAAARTFELLASGTLDGRALILFLLGFVSAGVVGGTVIRWLLRYVQTRSFRPFAWYRIVLGILILFITL